MRFIDTRTNQVVGEDDIESLVSDRYTEGMYEEYLDEAEDFDIFGISYTAGTVLHKVDPVRFRCWYIDELARIESDIMYGGTSHSEVGIEVVEDEENEEDNEE